MRLATALMSDADNTLWDTDRVYADAQLWLLSTIEEASKAPCPSEDRLEFVRKVDQAIAAKHHKGLRYPPSVLVAALADHLRGVAVNEAVRDALLGQVKQEEKLNAEEKEREFLERLALVPALRPGVDVGLERIHRFGVPIAVVTEGSAESCRSRLQYWGLETFVRHVISAPKSMELFLRIANLLGVDSKNCFVVGDQLDRDIAPAMLAGASTIYFPGGFTPRWAPQVDEVKPHFVISTFADVAKIIEESDASAAMASR